MKKSEKATPNRYTENVDRINTESGQIFERHDAAT